MPECHTLSHALKGADLTAHDAAMVVEKTAAEIIMALEVELQAWRDRFPQYAYRPQDDGVFLKSGEDGAHGRPLPAGARIAYLDVEATVVSDPGGPTLIVLPDDADAPQQWQWDFDGTTCQVLSIP